MFTLVLVLLVAIMAGQNPGQEERPKVPKDSVEIGIVGCLKGRVLKASDVRLTDAESGVVVRSRSFRLAGKGDVMKDVKKEDGHMVEVTGLVKRSALTQPGVRIGKRVVVGGGRPVAGDNRPPSPADNTLVLDVSSVRSRGGSCGG